MDIQFATYRIRSNKRNRYEQFLTEIRKHKKLESWTATSKFKIGDLVLFYFGIPYKSIIAIGFVSSKPVIEYDQFDWTKKNKEYFCDFEPVWLLENPIKLPSQNDAIKKWYSKKPYRSARILQENIAIPLLREIFQLNPELQKIEQLQTLFLASEYNYKINDEDKIDSLTIEDYKKGFQNIREDISEIDLKMLEVNLKAPNHTITASKLARVMDFANFNTANLRYGTFARKLCSFFSVKPAQYLYILVYFSKANNQWHWTLRENVIAAITELKLVESQSIPNIINDIEKFKTEQGAIESTTKQAIIQSRIGQGLFRANLIEYWGGCSVTGCQFIDILKASHIKPWRFSNNIERLDGYNGLLLIPNLDSLFDSGFISFDINGHIIISELLEKIYWERLGVSRTMKLRKLEDRHKKFIHFHRENIFLK